MKEEYKKALQDAGIDPDATRESTSPEQLIEHIAEHIDTTQVWGRDLVTAEQVARWSRADEKNQPMVVGLTMFVGFLLLVIQDLYGGKRFTAASGEQGAKVGEGMGLVLMKALVRRHNLTVTED